MRKFVVGCMTVMIVAVAIVMYMYWKEESAMIMKGVFVTGRGMMGQ